MVCNGKVFLVLDFKGLMEGGEGIWEVIVMFDVDLVLIFIFYVIFV